MLPLHLNGVTNQHHLCRPILELLLSERTFLRCEALDSISLKLSAPMASGLHVNTKSGIGQQHNCFCYYIHWLAFFPQMLSNSILALLYAARPCSWRVTLDLRRSRHLVAFQRPGERSRYVRRCSAGGLKKCDAVHE